jgi:hypothetical protein
MWVVYTFVGYLVLALLIPTLWALWPTWRRARQFREVMCPGLGTAALVQLDPWYAARMHALGNYEIRVGTCDRWPELGNCNRGCTAQLGATV